jgi:hypothetical protein
VPAATTAMLQQLVSAVAASCTPQSAPKQGPNSNMQRDSQGSPVQGSAAASLRTGQQQTGGMGPLQQAGFRQGPQGSARPAGFADQQGPAPGQQGQPAGFRQGPQGSEQPAGPPGNQQGVASGLAGSQEVSGQAVGSTAALTAPAAAGSSGGIDYSAALAAAAAAVFGELQSNKKQRMG